MNTHMYLLCKKKDRSSKESFLSLANSWTHTGLLVKQIQIKTEKNSPTSLICIDWVWLEEGHEVWKTLLLHWVMCHVETRVCLVWLIKDVVCGKDIWSLSTCLWKMPNASLNTLCSRQNLSTSSYMNHFFMITVIFQTIFVCLIFVLILCLSLAGNWGHQAWKRLQQLQEQCYPFLPMCAVFLCVQTMVWLSVFEMINAMQISFPF